MIECVTISEDVPLAKASQYVAWFPIPVLQSTVVTEPTAGAGEEVKEDTVDTYYQNMGVQVVPTVCDGDCGIDVMNMMLELLRDLETRRT